MFWGVILKILVDLGISLLTAILVMSYFDIFFEMKPRKYIKYIIYILFILWQLATEYIIKDIPFKINILLCVLFVFFTSCFYKGKIFGKSAVAVFYVVTWVLAEALTGAVFLIFDIDCDIFCAVNIFKMSGRRQGFCLTLNLQLNPLSVIRKDICVTSPRKSESKRRVKVCWKRLKKMTLRKLKNFSHSHIKLWIRQRLTTPFTKMLPHVKNLNLR